MGTRIKPDYKPSDRVYELLAPHLGTIERAKEFVGHEMGAFMMYWEGREDAGAAKANWDSTCLNWMKRTYEDKKEAMAQNRTFGKSKDNVFQEVAGKMISEDMDTPTKKKAPLYRLPDPPPDTGERMSTDEALDQLSKIFGGAS